MRKFEIVRSGPQALAAIFSTSFLHAKIVKIATTYTNTKEFTQLKIYQNALNFYPAGELPELPPTPGQLGGKHSSHCSPLLDAFGVTILGASTLCPGTHC